MEVPDEVRQGAEVGERQVGEERANLCSPLSTSLKFDGKHKLLVERQGAHRIRELPKEKLEQGKYQFQIKLAASRYFFQGQRTFSRAATECILSASEGLGFLPHWIEFFKAATVVACPDNL